MERRIKMKITAIRATPVNIPLEAPFFWSVGIYPGTSKTIIEVETEWMHEPSQALLRW